MSSIEGPLYAEVSGSDDADLMVFVHPNPQDRSSWMYQVAHFSHWYRCIAIDLPGYGFSPTARQGVTMPDLAEAVWDAVDRLAPGRKAILVGCSVGGAVAQHMYHLRPQKTDALVISGKGWEARKDFVAPRVASFKKFGIGHRYEYTLETFSQEFRRTPIAQWFAGLFAERNDSADLDSILHIFDALEVPDPDWLQRDLLAPVLVISGDQDRAHASAFVLRDRLPNAEIVTLTGAGHACHIEQPWEFDAAILGFLRMQGLLQLPNGLKQTESAPVTTPILSNARVPYSRND